MSVQNVDTLPVTYRSTFVSIGSLPRPLPCLFHKQPSLHYTCYLPSPLHRKLLHITSFHYFSKFPLSLFSIYLFLSHHHMQVPWFSSKSHSITQSFNLSFISSFSLKLSMSSSRILASNCQLGKLQKSISSYDYRCLGYSKLRDSSSRLNLIAWH